MSQLTNKNLEESRHFFFRIIEMDNSYFYD